MMREMFLIQPRRSSIWSLRLIQFLEKQGFSRSVAGQAINAGAYASEWDNWYERTDARTFLNKFPIQGRAVQGLI